MKKLPKGFYWTIKEFEKFYTTNPILNFQWENEDYWSKDRSGYLKLHPTLEPIHCSYEEIEKLKDALLELTTTTQTASVKIKNANIQFARNENVIGIIYSTTDSIWKNTSYTIYDLVLLINQLFPTSFQVQTGERNDIVIAAPHAPSESQVHEIVNRLSSKLKCGKVIAFGFRDTKSSYIPIPIGRCIHVNRPFEDLRNEKNQKISVQTPRAVKVFNQYVQHLKEASKSDLPIPFLVEIHGLRNRKTNAIQIAHNEFTQMQINQFLDLLRQETVKLNQYDVKILLEGFDSGFKFYATQAKNFGSLHPSVSQKSLHFEIPKMLREENAMNDLIDFLFVILSKMTDVLNHLNQ